VEFTGEYFDGRSALKRIASLSFTPTGLEIRYDDAVETWPYELIRRRRAGAVTHYERHDATARLTVDDPGFLSLLYLRCSTLDRGHGAKRRNFAIVGATIALVAGGVATAHFFPAVAARLLPMSWEERLGNQVVEMASMVLTRAREPRFCDDEPGAAAIGRLVAKLSQGLDSSYQVRVRVLDSTIVNAFAAPGGQIILMRGMIDFTETPEEFAGVLAHEIGHVVHRHPTESMFRRLNEGMLLDFVTGNARGGGVASAFANALIGASYSRDAENQADETALDLMTRLRISPQGTAAFFDRLMAKNKDSKGTILATHPPDAARAERARERAAKLGDPAPALSDAEWRAVKALCKT
jgi:Zn-dependent protease with chaperone function